jgi:hypothetical protein
MDCWSVTSDIKLVYEEYLDSPSEMDEDELSNMLIGIEYIYNRKFDRLFRTFEDVCRHGGIFLEEDLVTVAKQHRDYNKKLENMFDDVEFKGHKVEFPTKEDIQAASDSLKDKFSEPPDEYNNETQEDINNEWRE